MRRIVALAALLALAACGTTAANNTSITGTWSQVESIPGSKLILVLTGTGTTVTGIGDYALEAGRAGSLQVTGTFGDPAVSLSLAFDSGISASFSGTLSTPSQMTGTLSYAGSPGGSVVFNKQ